MHGERINQMFCGNNNSLLWSIIILILLFGTENGIGCGCGCNNTITAADAAATDNQTAHLGAFAPSFLLRRPLGRG
jgi:hypothetical protein